MENSFMVKRLVCGVQNDWPRSETTWWREWWHDIERISVELGDLQGSASTQHHEHVDQHSNFNLYINCF